MKKFICWPDAVDTAFRSRYLEITSENIQEFPLRHGGKSITGSSRVTSEDQSLLKSEFPEIEFFEEIPSEFIDTGASA